MQNHSYIRKAFSLLVFTAVSTFGQRVTLPSITPTARQQVRELGQWKRSLTFQQRKVGLDILAALKASQGLPLIPSLSRIDRLVQRVGTDRANGSVLVDVKGVVSPDLTAAIRGAGGTVVYSSVAANSLRAQVPLGTIEQLAGRTDVSSIRLASRPASQGVPARVPSWAAALNTFRLDALLAFPTPKTGLLASQGIVAHRAKDVFTLLGYQGAGVKIGVLSDSVDYLPNLIASGDIPASTVVLPDQSGNPNLSEGTAMLEIAYDMAPQAQLYFATGFRSPESFADNIRALRDAGCRIIVDDVVYPLESPFQDDVIARAVNDVTASGVLYFSAAGNFGNTTVGVSGTWEGDPVSQGDLFGDGTWDVVHINVLTAAGRAIALQWADPLGGSLNDYDLFAFDSQFLNVIDVSLDRQSGAEDAKEIVGINTFVPSSTILVAARYLGGGGNPQPRALYLSSLRGQLLIGTSGAIFGHTAARDAISVAAVNWNSARKGLRPFTGGAANPVEVFSSDGPRRIFFEPNGTPITPGNYLFATNGGTVLQKPDISAADGNSSVTPFFSPFLGTSAAAPHAAGIAALVLSAKPNLTRTQVVEIMRSTALDNMSAGWDKNSGRGITMALPAVQKALKY